MDLSHNLFEHRRGGRGGKEFTSLPIFQGAAADSSSVHSPKCRRGKKIRPFFLPNFFSYFETPHDLNRGPSSPPPASISKRRFLFLFLLNGEKGGGAEKGLEFPEGGKQKGLKELLLPPFLGLSFLPLPFFPFRGLDYIFSQERK